MILYNVWSTNVTTWVNSSAYICFWIEVMQKDSTYFFTINCVCTESIYKKTPPASHSWLDLICHHRRDIFFIFFWKKQWSQPRQILAGRSLRDKIIRCNLLNYKLTHRRKQHILGSILTTKFALTIFRKLLAHLVSFLPKRVETYHRKIYKKRSSPSLLLLCLTFVVSEKEDLCLCVKLI